MIYEGKRNDDQAIAFRDNSPKVEHENESVMRADVNVSDIHSFIHLGGGEKGVERGRGRRWREGEGKARKGARGGW